MKVSLLEDNFVYKIHEVVLLTEEQYLKYDTQEIIKQLSSKYNGANIASLKPNNCEKSDYYMVVAYNRILSFTNVEAEMCPIEKEEFKNCLIKSLIEYDNC